MHVVVWWLHALHPVVCCGVTVDCDALQAEYLEERSRQEEQRRREKHRQDHLRSALDQVHLGLITVTVWYCVVCCAVLCSFLLCNGS